MNKVAVVRGFAKVMHDQKPGAGNILHIKDFDGKTQVARLATGVAECLRRRFVECFSLQFVFGSGMPKQGTNWLSSHQACVASRCGTEHLADLQATTTLDDHSITTRTLNGFGCSEASKLT